MSPQSRIVEPLGNPPSTMLSRSAIPVGTFRTRVASSGSGRASTLRKALSLVRAIPIEPAHPARADKALLQRVWLEPLRYGRTYGGSSLIFNLIIICHAR